MNPSKCNIQPIPKHVALSTTLDERPRTRARAKQSKMRSLRGFACPNEWSAGLFQSEAYIFRTSGPEEVRPSSSASDTSEKNKARNGCSTFSGTQTTTMHDQNQKPLQLKPYLRVSPTARQSRNFCE